MAKQTASNEHYFEMSLTHLCFKKRESQSSLDRFVLPLNAKRFDYFQSECNQMHFIEKQSHCIFVFAPLISIDN